MKRLLSYRPDFLIWMILLGVIAGIVLPVRGDAAEVADWVVKIAIAFLFFLYGARLAPQEALRGLLHWRLHVLILLFTFVLFPVVGLAFKPLTPWIGEDMYMGILFMTLVPSTVQSSVAFTSIARGNVAASIVAASASSLVGVVITPLLVLLLMTAPGGVHVDGGTFINIGVQLLLPFFIGQILRPWVKGFAASKMTKKVDQISIGLVVYVSFSEGMVQGIWSSVAWQAIVGLVLGSVVLVYLMLWVTSVITRKLNFNYEDQVAIQFAGTKKSLAAGLPMAAVMFGSTGLGLMILPLMIFHQMQLIICSIRASTYAERYEQSPETAHTW
ncbi:bile acid:sodium symporter family protein [Corynebacterium sp. ED61]|uniref:bile acid:sodium symporter family protein n=1 Tax=Corynebacterium sp. ED61 TaxID=2211360 RepID=UPI0018836281|nr:bile acid:sodium symporter family protein [Corynebacterium sp. ED61]MBF0582144.1 bile acid:sodium symporter [Corynebacterium sp. ED61]